ncbi:MAG: homing endonuclease associated repeat-containing protein [Acutalibacteraceae bacterium]
MIKEKDIDWATKQLKLKSEELNRQPKKDDFNEITRSRIKAFLGPWPRALEKAGLKEIKKQTKKTKRRTK